MLKRDFIMIQIEELAKVVLQIIMNRNTNAARHTPELIQTIYSSLKLDRPTLMTACLLYTSDAADERQAMLQKAKTILEYIQTHDNTFSLERVNMLDELERRIL